MKNNNERDLNICQLYNNGMSTREIAEIYNIHYTTVLNVLKKNKINIRNSNPKHKFNYNFFNKIDTEEKAYWLGFLWCDGAMTKNYNFNIEISKRDENHLVKLKKSIDSQNGNIRYYERKYGFKDYEKEPTINCRLVLSNKHFVKTLIEEYGLIPKRYKIDKLKNKIPQELMRHFIRGVIDADGSITYIKNNDAVNIQICTYEELIDWISEFLYCNNIIKSIPKKYKRHKERDEHVCQITIGGSNQGRTLLDYLYKESTVYLDRKYEKYIEIKNKL